MTPTRSGPHQVLLAVYALFTLSAGARAGVQLATEPHRAPVAYALSVAAAVTYALGWWAIRRAAHGRTGFAARMLWVELAGVLVVGTLSLLRRDLFPDMSVWSDYGVGYGFVPAALPVAGLLWVRRLRAGEPGSSSTRTDARIVTAFRVVAVTESVTWLGLLIGMFFKYVVDAGDGGVRVFGPIHGVVFIGYVALALVTAGLRRWPLGTTALALAASVPPFCTVLFEIWAQQTGRFAPTGPDDNRPDGADPDGADPGGELTASSSSAPR